MLLAIVHDIYSVEHGWQCLERRQHCCFAGLMADMQVSLSSFNNLKKPYMVRFLETHAIQKNLGQAPLPAESVDSPLITNCIILYT